MLDFRPDAQLKDIRGNVPTRLGKLDEGLFDAILLAAAGVTRLGIDLSAYHIVRFNPKEFVPAPAQGVLAWQARTEDTATRRLLQRIHEKDTAEVTNRLVIFLYCGVGVRRDFGLSDYNVWRV